MTSEADVRRILDDHADRLTQLPNVVGVGLVDAEGTPGATAVAVYVRSKVPLAQLRPSDIVPRTLTSTIGGLPVQATTRVIEVGDITR